MGVECGESKGLAGGLNIASHHSALVCSRTVAARLGMDGEGEE